MAGPNLARPVTADAEARMAPRAEPARNALDRMRADLRLGEWITQDLFGTLDSCTVAEEFIELVEQIIAADRGSDIRE